MQVIIKQKPFPIWQRLNKLRSPRLRAFFWCRDGWFEVDKEHWNDDEYEADEQVRTMKLMRPDKLNADYDEGNSVICIDGSVSGTDELAIFIDGPPESVSEGL